jgi:hypothetical protein
MPLQPEGLAHAFGDLGARSVVAVERHTEVPPKLRAIGLNYGAQLIERFDRQSAWIGSAL